MDNVFDSTNVALIAVGSVGALSIFFMVVFAVVSSGMRHEKHSIPWTFPSFPRRGQGIRHGR